MATVFDVLRTVAGLMKGVRHGVASGGSTTTLVDNTQVTDPNDHYNGGTLFMLSGDNALSTLLVTGFVGSTGTFTFAAITVAIAAEDKYVALRGMFPRASLIGALNTALREHPLMTYSILTASADGEESYLLQGVYRLLRVEYTVNNESPYAWQRTYSWEEVYNRLQFDKDEVPVAEKFKLYYFGIHAYVSEDDDYVTDYIHSMRLAWRVAYYAYLERAGISGMDEPHSAMMLQESRRKSNEFAERFPIEHQHKNRDPRLPARNQAGRQ